MGKTCWSEMHAKHSLFSCSSPTLSHGPLIFFLNAFDDAIAFTIYGHQLCLLLKSNVYAVYSFDHINTETHILSCLSYLFFTI